MINTNRVNGFTLLELMIVMLILVLAVGAISINLARGNPATELKATARDLVSALRYARGQALMQHKPIWVEINLSDNCYTLSSRHKRYSFSSAIEVSLTIAEQDYDDKDTGRIQFYPDGSSSGGRIELELQGLKQQIDINWLNGQVSMSDESG